ncbi:hypothetical protein BTA31_22130 [Bacillus haynesii]|uniref:Uncharacterized protein n=1 Tax=Bacillus haynesii TaxID=1925021 RepID=A0ABX3HXA5_9BACI|nr:hypothetical protein [Bacillus haynesii]OMI24528.1 hypothetical protein BTA31_22130 [Bacillus haynesii]
MKEWFLYVFIATLISMFIQSGLDKIGLLNLNNMWTDLSWLVIFFVVYVLIDLAGRALIGSKNN